MKVKVSNNQLARTFEFFFFFFFLILTKDTEDKRNCKMVVEFELLAKSGLIKLAAENILINDHMKDFPPEGQDFMKRLQLTR